MKYEVWLYCTEQCAAYEGPRITLITEDPIEAIEKAEMHRDSEHTAEIRKQKTLQDITPERALAVLYSNAMAYADLEHDGSYIEDENSVAYRTLLKALNINVEEAH